MHFDFFSHILRRNKTYQFLQTTFEETTFVYWPNAFTKEKNILYSKVISIHYQYLNKSLQKKKSEILFIFLSNLTYMTNKMEDSKKKLQFCIRFYFGFYGLT